VANESATDHPSEKHNRIGSSQLFLLRVWLTQKDGSQRSKNIAGKVQDPVSGQAQYFSGGMDLVQVLLRMIRKEVNGQGEVADDEGA
jgi:hypothetical protein